MVQPIRSKEKIDRMKQALKAKDEKYYIMWLIGCNTALRVSDILNLKVWNIKEERVEIREKKTNKLKRFGFNDKIQRELLEYCERFDSDDAYIIPSRKGTNQPISRVQAYRVLQDAAKVAGLKQNEIGTHTMRKTYGYWHYKKYHDVAMLQQTLNHCSPAVTLTYIGITEDIIIDQMKALDL